MARNKSNLSSSDSSETQVQDSNSVEPPENTPTPPNHQNDSNAGAVDDTNLNHPESNPEPQQSINPIDSPNSTNPPIQTESGSETSQSKQDQLVTDPEKSPAENDIYSPGETTDKSPEAIVNSETTIEHVSTEDTDVTINGKDVESKDSKDSGETPVENAEVKSITDLETSGSISDSKQSPLPGHSEALSLSVPVSDPSSAPSSSRTSISRDNASRREDQDASSVTTSKRRSRRSPSMALSISSTSSGQPALSSAVFVKKALEHIAASRDAKRISNLERAVSKALSEYNNFSRQCFFSNKKSSMIPISYRRRL